MRTRAEKIAVTVTCVLILATAFIVQMGSTSNLGYESLLDGNELSVATQNMYIPGFFDKIDRMRMVAEQAFQEQTDLLLLQEVLFPYEVSFLGEEYEVYYEPGRVGPKGGLVTVSKKGAHSVSFVKFEKQSAMTLKQKIEGLIEKGILIVRYDDAVVINTHLVSVGQQELGSAEWKANEEQLDQLLEVVRAEMQSNKRIILGGDLNFDTGTIQYAKLSALLQDISDGAHAMIEHPNRPAQIDFIFSNFGKHVELDLFDYETFVSDHPGIFSSVVVG